ncbi:hypothetical protein [Mucilaginibacter lappiensis]|uniref:Uncharacterized protein n=1 Tax=Mucilaginibacter lappiensis TaxID=354630 RepID=A0A841JDF1_9SPHI|nr:hypothetical protein [Mucilaginibacter lappiensis]MBB6128634.1 hypothetical protein [Mucilaginibacter lappiensis]
MQRHEVLYDSLLRLLREFTLAGAQFEAYFDQLLNDVKEQQLLAHGEEIDKNITDIIKSKGDLTIHSTFQPLINSLTDFETDFPDFPFERKDEVLIIIKIIDIINIEVTGSGSVFDLTQPVDETLFCLNHVPRLLSSENFLYYDLTDVKNSVIVFDTVDLSKLFQFLETGIPIELLLALLTKLGAVAAPVISGINALVRSDLDGLENAVFACSALHIVKSGKLIHAPYNYPAPPKVSSQRIVNSSLQYQQFSESLHILSEYNHQKDILDKYLRIYHLIENFMFKYPVVSLERSHAGTAFSIRDFRVLYGKVDKSESTALKELFEAVMDLDFDPAAGVKFQKATYDAWTAIVPALIADKLKIDKLLELINVTTAKGNAILYDSITKEEDFPAFFAKLVYGFRNSIVHNRETEFHLTHKTLIAHVDIGDTAKIIVEQFLIPWLEEISFYLIIEDNQLVWYNGRTLALWNE